MNPVAHSQKGIFESARDAIGDAMQAVKDRIIGGSEVAKDAVSKSFDTAKQTTGNVVEGAKDFGQDAFNVAGDAVGATKNAAGKAYEKTADLLESAKDTTVEAAEKVYEKTANIMGAAKETAGDAVDATKHAAQRAYNVTADAAQSAMETAENAMASTKGAANNAYIRAAEVIDDGKQRTGEVFSTMYYPESYRGMTIDEIQRKGLTADYPSMMPGHNQVPGAYRQVLYTEPKRFRQEASEANRALSDAVHEAGREAADLSKEAVDTGRSFLGSVAGKVKDAVHAVSITFLFLNAFINTLFHYSVCL